MTSANNSTVPPITRRMISTSVVNSTWAANGAATKLAAIIGTTSRQLVRGSAPGSI